jgi:tetratricopeptide (TPR) repeat protein
MFEWFSDLLHTVLASPAHSTPSQITLGDALARYEQSLRDLDDDAEKQLAVLLARDLVDNAIRQAQPVSVSAIQNLGDLDDQLKSKIITFPAESLTTWRDITQPSERAWWWWGDKKSAERVEKNNLPWEILTGTFLVLTTPLLLDILKRLWDGAPDIVSVYGTLLTLLLTASPLVKQGRQAATAISKFVFRITPKRQSRFMAFTALIIFLVMLVLQQWVLPYPLATYYNNQGAVARNQGNLQQAKNSFQRAAALNPDRVVPYYNLAEAYQQIGLSKQAQEWYEKAIQGDVNFAPAYRGLGQANNENGDFAAAERVLMAGLQATFTSSDEVTVNVTKYELLANLGWSYFGQEKLDLAKAICLEALALEPELKTLGDTQGAEYRLALPHFILAQIYEQASDVPNARQQWEDGLRFLDASDIRQRERILTAQQHLLALPTK